MNNYRLRFLAGGSVALLALLLTACDDPADTAEEPTDSEAHETSEETEDTEADPAAAGDEEDAEADEPGEESAGESGSRDDPLQLGETFESGDWAVTINSFTPDADDEVAGENQFNDPAPDGSSYALIHADATYHGDESEMVMMGVDIAYVSASGETINASDTHAIAPEELESSAELYNGGTESGNVALAVPDEGDGLIRVRLGFMDKDEAFFTAE